MSSDGQVNEGVLGENLYIYSENNPVMYSDSTGCAPEWMKWTIGTLVIAGTLTAVILTGGTALAVAALIGASVGAGIGLVSGISMSDDKVSFDSNKASTGFMLGAISGAISGTIGSKIDAVFRYGEYIPRMIMAGVNGSLSFGSYFAQAGLNEDNISLGGALIALGIGTFSFLEPTDGRIFDAFSGPMMGAEIAWIYDFFVNPRNESKSSNNKN